MRSSLQRTSVLRGVFFGVTAATLWALYFVYTRKGAVTGLEPQDIVLLRFGVSGVILSPFVFWHGLRTLGTIGWQRGTILAICVGPAFAYFAATGFHWAPLAHGAVLQPATAFLVSATIAVFLLKERMDTLQMAGSFCVLLGLCVIGGVGLSAIEPDAWRGDLLFMIAGAQWAVFTVLLRHWQLDSFRATAALSFVSALVIIPYFLLFDSFDRLAALSTADLLAQIGVHGILAAILGLVSYGYAVAHLGASRAALFPSIVPAIALLLGIPFLGEWPIWLELLGACLATGGLILAIRSEK